MKICVMRYSLSLLAVVSLIGCGSLSVETLKKHPEDAVAQESSGAAAGATREPARPDLALSGDTPAVLPSVVPRTADPFVTGLSLFYIPVPSPMPVVPADVGQADGSISASAVQKFRAEYARALGSFFPLAGVLGADRLHRWTNKARDGTVISALVQNWKSSIPLPNGFGLPQLVLAMDGADGGTVHCIIPPILDIYSQGRGLGRAGGLAGYGKPMTGPFLVLDGESYVYAQWFSFSLIQASLDTQGRSSGQVNLEPAPSLTARIPSGVGLLPEGTKSEALVKTWLQALDLGFPQGSAGNPDGPAVYLESPPAESTLAESHTIAVQTFDKGRWAIMQTGKGSDPVLIFPPFMDLFVSGKTDYSTALALAISAYGPPLANAYAMPLAYLWQSPDVKAALEGHIRSENPYIPLLVQRFQRGLWVAVPKTAVPKAD
jgi:hypothetical protein